MENTNSKSEWSADKMTKDEEQKILEEIEESFNVAGYEVLHSEVVQECIRDLKEA